MQTDHPGTAWRFKIAGGVSSGKAQHLDAQVGILGSQLAVCDRDAPHSLTVGGGSPVPGGRKAHGQQPRPGEQLLAQGAGEVVTFVDAALLQDRPSSAPLSACRRA